MAVTAVGAALTRHHQRSQLAVRAQLLKNLGTLWPLFNPADFDTFDRFSSLAAVLVGQSYVTSAGLAAGYLSQFRLVEGQRGSVTPVITDAPAADVIKSSLRATGLLGVLNARRGGFPLEAAKRNGWVRLAGSAGSLALRGGRDTITATVDRDPKADGWQRVTTGTCAYCGALAVNGEGLQFEAHDHCACVAEPRYSGSLLPATTVALAAVWERATAGKSGDEAQAAFRAAIDSEDDEPED